MSVLILMGLFILFLLLSVPVGISIGLTILVMLCIDPITSFSFLGQAMVTSLINFPLLSVPFFMLTGAIMEAGGLSKRLVKVGEELVGRRTGGLAVVTIVVCLFFGAISGSAPATVAAIGTIMIPAMVKRDYAKEYAAGLIAVSGGLGVIIPPSIPFVFYGVATNTSIGDLFTAGIFPGILVALLLIITSTIICKRRGYKGTDRPFSFRGLLKAIWEAKWALMVPVIILGGIYGGVFTPTESAVVGVVYAMVVGFFAYKELTIKNLIRILKENGSLIGSVVITMATATALGTLFSMMRLPEQIVTSISQVSSNKYVILLIINIFLIFVGMCMDTVAAILIFSPILLSIVQPLGIHPVHFGIIMTVNLCIGFVTPPVAMNLFVASGISGVPMMKISKETVPFIFAFLVGLVLIILFPQICLWFM